MTLGDLALIGYGAVVGFGLGCAVAAAVAIRRIGFNPDTGSDDVHTCPYRMDASGRVSREAQASCERPGP